MRRRRGLLGCLALAAAFLTLPVSAQAFGIQASGPPTVDTGSPHVLPYSATFSAGVIEESFEVFVSPPASIDGGYTMQLVGPPTVTGDAGFSIYMSAPGPPGFGCSRIPGLTTHGYQSTSVTAEVDLPPGGEVTFTFLFRTGDLPIRPGDSLSPSMLIPQWKGEGPPPPSGPIPWPEPPRAGPVGVNFGLRTRPGGPAAHFPTPPAPFSEGTLVQVLPKRIKRGVPIDIFGKTTPALTRQKVNLIYVGPRHLQPRRLARVKTDARGHFRLLDWKPKRPGTYEISAAYHSRLPGIRSDFAACSKQLLVGRPK